MERGELPALSMSLDKSKIGSPRVRSRFVTPGHTSRDPVAMAVRPSYLLSSRGRSPEAQNPFSHILKKDTFKPTGLIPVLQTRTLNFKTGDILEAVKPR